MTALRQQMKNDTVLRGMAVRTRQSYIEAVRGLTKFYRRSPDQIAVGEVQSYLLHLLQERRLSHSACNLVTNRTGRPAPELAPNSIWGWTWGARLL